MLDDLGVIEQQDHRSGRHVEVHLLSLCKLALSQGRYRWCHDLTDKVLQKLAEILEVRRVETARERLPPTRQPIHFVREGRRAHNLRVDLDRQLRLPTHHRYQPSTGHHSLVCHSPAVILAELKAPLQGVCGSIYEAPEEYGGHWPHTQKGPESSYATTHWVNLPKLQQHLKCFQFEGAV